MISLIIFNILASVAFAVILKLLCNKNIETNLRDIEKIFSTRNPLLMTYFILLMLLTVFYIGVTIAFSCVIKKVMNLMYAFDDMTKSRKLMLWSGFFFYTLLMTMRVLIFVALRFIEDQIFLKGCETCLYSSEVVLMSFMIFIIWYNRIQDAQEEEYIEERAITGVGVE